jgi:hypothetical protein
MIKCAACQKENADGSAKCLQCGKALIISGNAEISLRRRKLPLLITLLTIVLIAVAAGVWVRKEGEVSGSTANKLPELPEPVVTAPQPDAAQSKLGDMYYPGSISQSGIQQGNNTMIVLVTADPIGKVRDYYKSKLDNINLIMDEPDRFTMSFDRDASKKGLVSATQQDGHTEITLGIGSTAPALPPSKNQKAGKSAPQ